MPISPAKEGSPAEPFSSLLRYHMDAGTCPAGRRGERWTAEDLAEKVQVTPRTIYNYLNGRTIPKDVVGNIRRMVEAFFGDNLRHAEARAHFLAVFDRARGIEAPIDQKPIHPDLNSIGDLFTGRDDFLDHLHGAFQRPSGVSSTIRALHGMGGIGKTRTAMEYALRHRDHYTALLFARAFSPATLHREIAELTKVLRLAERNASDDNLRNEAVRGWLAGHSRWLLIMDNVDTLDALRAASEFARSLHTGYVLMTSRLDGEFAHGIETVELGLLTPADAINYLLKATANRRRFEPNELSQASLLAEALGYLVLALVHAAAYIAERRITFALYLVEWHANRSRVLEWAKEAVTGYPLSLAQTWVTSVDQLTAAGKALLERLSFFANDPVPEFLLDVPLFGASAAAGLDPILELQRFSLIFRDEETERFTVHRIVRDVTNRSMKIAPVTPVVYRMRRMEALGWINAALGDPDPTDVSTWDHLNPLAPHAEALAWSANEAGIADPTGRIMYMLGLLFTSQAQYARAEPLMRCALGHAEKNLRADSPIVARHLVSLARLLKETNRLSEAEPLFRRALAINDARVEPTDPDMATCLDDLASLLRDTNRPTEAEPLFRRSLAIAEAFFGPDHPEVAAGLNHLGLLLHDMNRPVEAEVLFRRALAINETSFGLQHPTVATSLTNLAGLLRDSNSPAETEALYRRALAINEMSYGSEHPEVATALNNLADLFQDMGRIMEAEALFRRALAATEASLGPDHPDVAIKLNNLGVLYCETDQLTEAEPYFCRALAIAEASFGPDHPTVSRYLNNLGILHQDSGRHDEAESLYRRALAIAEAGLDPMHPTVATRLNNLATVLRATGRQAEAEPLFRRALAIDEANYGPEHPELVASLNNLALLLDDLGHLEETTQLMRRAVIICFAIQKATGQKDTEGTVGYYADLLSKSGYTQKEINSEIAKLRRNVS
jgi:tetratricopeptide (TPR) repeat protein/transcriptional regulator with XRE-family HTH domain